MRFDFNDVKVLSNKITFRERKKGEISTQNNIGTPIHYGLKTVLIDLK